MELPIEKGRATDKHASMLACERKNGGNTTKHHTQQLLSINNGH